MPKVAIEVWSVGSTVTFTEGVLPAVKETNTPETNLAGLQGRVIAHRSLDTDQPDALNVVEVDLGRDGKHLIDVATSKLT